MRRKRADGSPRLVVIGLDGADWDVMMPLIEQGALPNLSRLMDEGCHGALRSTFPPHTPCAWSTIFTGVNPAKHGIFTFRTLIPGTYTCRLTTDADRKAPALWEMLSTHGLRVGVFNVPMTYPAEKVNGFMVSGMMGAPDANETAFYPRELKDQVYRIAPSFSMKVEARKGSHYPVSKMQEHMAGRTALIRQLLHTQPTDVFIAVCTYTDAVQHHWLADPSVRPAGAEEVLRRTYVNADNLLGDVLDAVGDDVDILILSDHGSGPVNLYLNLDRLLEEKGWESLRKGMTVSTGRIARALGRRLRRVIGMKPAEASSHPINYDLRWERTMLYSLGTHVSLRLNLEGREPQGVVPADEYHDVLAHVSQTLSDIEIPKAPWAHFETRHRDQLFSGPYLDLMPDLVALTPHGQTLTMPHRPYLASQPAFLTPREAVTVDPDIVRGTHRLEGIILGRGPSFAAHGQLSGAGLQDITPTLLQVLGLPVPAYMDGKPLVSMLRDKKKAMITEQAMAERDSSVRGETYTEQEAAQVEKRLRDLGYL